MSENIFQTNRSMRLATVLKSTTALHRFGGAAPLAMATLAMALGAANAQESDSTQAPTTVRSAPISVTATRSPMKAFDVPGLVTVKGAKEIADEIPASLDDLFDDIPGVTSFGGPRRTGEVPTIRGFSGPDVIVTLDGARQNFVSGHDGRAFIDPAFLGEAEVVRGSSSALYGSGGTGGIIALRTLTADDFLKDDQTIGGRVGLSYRSGNDEFAQRIVGAWRPSDMTDVTAGIVRRRSYDVRLGNDVKLDSEDDILSGFVRGEFRENESSGVRLGWNRFRNDAREPNNGQAAAGTLADKNIDSETISGGFFFNPPTNPVLDAEVTVYRTTSSVDEKNLTGTQANQLQERKLTTFGFNADNTSNFALADDIDLSLTVGLDFYTEDAEGALNGGVRGGVVTGDQQFYGIFAQSAFSFYDLLGLEGSELTVTPGFRYDNFDSADSAGNKTEDNQLSPKVSVRFAPTEWGFVYGSYAEAFRAPRLDELFPTGTHFPVFTATNAIVGFNTFITNTTLKPQSTDTWEGGLGVEFENVFGEGDVLQAKGGYYSIKGENFLTTQVTQTADTTNPQFFPAPILVPGFTCRAFVSITVDPNGCGGTTQIVNVASAELDGFELETSYDSSRIRVTLAGSTMDTKNKATGDPIGVEQPDQLTADLRLKLPEIDSFIGWQATVADKHDGGTVTANDRKSYQVHEVYGRWRAEEGVLSGFSIGVTAENLFDEEYQRVSSETLEEGRSVLVDVSYRLAW
ncbi:TonB-dependent hemoglobin/transferrin/lactoferrin family receptor [Pyruvatibacter sp. HU-CL02332]|uniref:TonB-dependent receptor domain-containing protein n=1 Tax=Pyruvatibacter sp. HU-CL02332 TaxID=3127650 RepID=UPI003103FB1C